MSHGLGAVPPPWLKRTVWPSLTGLNRGASSVGGADSSRVTWVARFRGREPLLSGWLEGAERVQGKGALAVVRLGRGRVVLFGFRPQYRAQSLATYPLLFNALRWGKGDRAE